MPTRSRAAAILAAASILATAAPAAAQERVTLKSAKSASSYYQMMVQLAEALKRGTGGDVIATVEESQGSVQNVKEAAKRPGAYVFTSPPSLVEQAQAGAAPFEGEEGYDAVRGLFAIPYLTMHWVVRADSGVEDFEDLEGKAFIPGGKGSFGERKTAEVFEKLGVADAVDLVDVELDAAVPAVKNDQVAGFATAGSHPAPNVMELAAGTDIRLLSLDEDDLAQLGAGADAVIEIPAGTYPGVDEPVTTLSLPVGAYTTERMDEATAYAVTKAFWEQRDEMAEDNAWWGAVTPDTLATLAAPLHPGALRYYEEAGIEVPAGLR